MGRSWRRCCKFYAVLFVSIALFAVANAQLFSHPRTFPEQSLEVVLPRVLQAVMAGGDRYLAANINVLRSLLNPTAQDSHDHFIAQAQIQADAAWLNPRHEDNYYLAAAMLSWSGHVKTAEEILTRATESRPFDVLPPFFLGFDYFHFDQNPIEGAHWLYQAAARADEQNRISLSRIAARWAERGQDAKEALRMVILMRDQARGHALKGYFSLRIQRLEGLVALQEAAQQYVAREGHPPSRLEQLRDAGLIRVLPVDPLGLGYTLDSQGIPQLVLPPPRGPIPNASRATP